ncbi:MAG TPA: XdhC/CoxI family protein [Acidimicrobiales bacterium]|jgi:xanthine dehydrogenase accessory factor|nr:XdhC/CoxI family protein [Acidimicrobiales bacterium]
MPGELYNELQAAIRGAEPVALATVIVGPPELLGASMLIRGGPGADDAPETVGSLGHPNLDRVVASDAMGELDVGRSGTRHYGLEGEARESDLSVFIESFARPPKMIIFGAVDFTAALAKVAKVLGYHVTVSDPRPIFATRKRFPMADELAIDWPNRYLDKIGGELGPRDAVCVLTHDAKLDVPAITSALKTRVGYIGVMGNRRTHAKRAERLREAGVDDEGLGRMHAPIGLDIGARTPEETAISICGQIISLRTGHQMPSLADRQGPIHARGGDAEAESVMGTHARPDSSDPDLSEPPGGLEVHEAEPPSLSEAEAVSSSGT